MNLIFFIILGKLTIQVSQPMLLIVKNIKIPKMQQPLSLTALQHQHFLATAHIEYNSIIFLTAVKR